MSSIKQDQIALAAEQLDVAIEMFLTGRSEVSVLTLAGAAEEILGRAVKLMGDQNTMQQAYEARALSHRYLHGKALKWKDFADGENYARNAAKHLFGNDDTYVEVDLNQAAMWMIVRAYANYDRLGLQQTDRMREFDNWFYEFEVGV